MGKISRFGVSIEESLLSGFDALITRKGYANRSEALRALIRNMLLETRIEEDPETKVVGTLTLVYDHDRGDLINRLVKLQHVFHHHIVSTLHVHIDAHNCLEVLVVKGKTGEVRRISDSLSGTRGVHSSKLVISEARDSGDSRGHDHP